MVDLNLDFLRDKLHYGRLCLVSRATCHTLLVVLPSLRSPRITFFSLLIFVLYKSIILPNSGHCELTLNFLRVVTLEFIYNHFINKINSLNSLQNNPQTYANNKQLLHLKVITSLHRWHHRSLTIMAGVLFEDIFDVKDIDTEGKKFDRGKC